MGSCFIGKNRNIIPNSDNMKGITLLKKQISKMPKGAILFKQQAKYNIINTTAGYNWTPKKL
jgi:hypothetical protein